MSTKFSIVYADDVELVFEEMGYTDGEPSPERTRDATAMHVYVLKEGQSKYDAQWNPVSNGELEDLIEYLLRIAGRNPRDWEVSEKIRGLYNTNGTNEA
jgi:hypothetical protein